MKKNQKNALKKKNNTEIDLEEKFEKNVIDLLSTAIEKLNNLPFIRDYKKNQDFLMNPKSRNFTEIKENLDRNIKMMKSSLEMKKTNRSYSSIFYPW